jgi:hypothetical protein
MLASDPAAENLALCFGKPDTTTKNTETARAVYEVVENTQSGLTFKIFCSLEDLHILQGESRKTWRSYRDNKIDLLVNAVITIVVIQLVANTEQELLFEHNDFLSNASGRSSCEKMAHILLATFRDDKAHGFEMMPFHGFMYPLKADPLLGMAELGRIWIIHNDTVNMRAHAIP